MTFGERFKQARAKKGFSQSELGKSAGIHYTQIGRYESKGAIPSADILTKLAAKLGVSSEYLINGSTNEQAANALEDQQLLQQFKKVESLPSDKQLIIKELIDAFLLKQEIQQKFI